MKKEGRMIDLKIICGMLGHEANTFSVEKGTLARFLPEGSWVVDDEVFKRHKGAYSFIGGMMQVAEEENVELLPTVAFQGVGPALTKDCFDTVLGELLKRIEHFSADCDGICLALHGAGVAENADDMEEYTLREVRKIVGDKIPITVCLDLHGNITQGMVDLSNGLFGIKEYPHTDEKEAGSLAMRSLIRQIRNEIKTETFVEPLHMLIPCTVGMTTGLPMSEFTDFVREKKAEYNLVDASLFHGFPYADVPFSSASVVTVSDKNSKLSAEDAAKKIAAEIWREREKLNVKLPTAEEAIQKALKMGEGDKPIIINEASDNVGAGCPGDGTYLLKALLAANSPRTIYGYIHDEEMALKAHAAGVGACIAGTLGGKTDGMHGTPVEVPKAEVLALSNGEAIYETKVMYHMPVHYGKVARIKIGNVEVIVTEKVPEQTFDDRPFIVAATDFKQYNIVCLKSAVHFRSFFGDSARAVISVDSPGIQTGNLELLEYKKVTRPIWPLDTL